MRRKLLLGVTLVALITVGLATYSWAAGDARTIDACVADGDGSVRVVDAGTACKKKETGISWNTVGPQGPVGATGATGPAGPAGPAGKDGASSAAPADPNATTGTVTLTGQKTTTFSPFALTGITHEIVSPRDIASGQATGKRQHKPLTITKEIDKNTPLLLSTLFTNENLTSVLIGLLRNGQQIATVKLTNAQVSNYVTHGTTESWSFTYQKITWTWVDGGISASDDWSAPVS